MYNTHIFPADIMDAERSKHHVTADEMDNSIQTCVDVIEKLRLHLHIR